MERRDVLKKMGAATLLGATGLIAFACTNTDNQIVESNNIDSNKISEPAIEELSERDKLIVNRMKMTFADPANPTDHELKHTPNISFGKPDENGFVEIDVILGMNGIIHPALKEHWIDYLTFYVNDVKIAHMENENGPMRGAAKILYILQSGDKVKVEAGCNLHGIWENTAVFTI